MNQRTCTIDGCERPHLARGYCRPHYRKHANPDKPRDRRVIITCTDCGETVQKLIHTNSDRTRCVPCAFANRGKTIGAKLKTNWPCSTVHTQRCQHCGQAFTSQRPRVTCGRTCRLARQAARVRETTCRDCGGIRPMWSTFCTACQSRRLAEARRTHKAKRRAWKRAVPAETVRPREVFERDGWTCGICAEDVDKTLTYPHPRSASLDHIIPLSRDGHHTYENTQCAHLACNRAKSDSIAA